MTNTMMFLMAKAKKYELIPMWVSLVTGYLTATPPFSSMIWGWCCISVRLSISVLTHADTFRKWFQSHHTHTPLSHRVCERLHFTHTFIPLIKTKDASFKSLSLSFSAHLTGHKISKWRWQDRMNNTKISPAVLGQPEVCLLRGMLQQKQKRIGRFSIFKNTYICLQKADPL